MRIEKLRVAHNLTIRWTHFPLHPDTPAEGRTLEALFGATTEQVARIQGEMRDRMKAEGLPYGDRSRTYNSRLAQELGAWADSLDSEAGARTHHAFFEAYFVGGYNLADRTTLLDIVRSVGLPAEEAQRVIDERLFGDAVDRDWDRSRRLGISGVPTFVMDRQAVVGAQPYDVLDRFVQGVLKSGG